MGESVRNLLLDSLSRVLRDHCGPDRVQAAVSSGWDRSLWEHVEELGFAQAAIPQELGGAGISFADSAALLRLAAYHSAPIPLAETGLLAGWALAASGHPLPDGPHTVAPVDHRDEVRLEKRGGAWTLSGRVRRVPMARAASRIVVFSKTGDRECVALVDPAACKIRPGANLAGEARDEVVFDGVALEPESILEPVSGINLRRLLERGALVRAAQISGALDRCLDLCVTYVNERKQFGRPLGKFQAIQHQMAVFAAEVSAANAMVELAAEDVEREGSAPMVAAAKIRAGEAATLGARIAHQIHGAMGFTEEYPLQLSTRRLWSWRDEFGSEALWALTIGRSTARAGADHLWNMVTQFGTL